ncbi:hypothetical protein [Oerskovia gallyi]|uniref:Uncharacterized protein n=1 Tax=Oerskovia gallyi TaxID=2762226 RepID=A0ABR8UY74_9CELL|nr:hypothetical protein [Oerskovia gallyi]MBD7997493.1 hypothetical protein [Oerskovia gallyi]
MRIEFYFGDDFTVLSDHEIAGIARVVGGVEDGWHELVAPDPADVRFEPYFQQNPTHRELLEKSYMSAFAYGRLSARKIPISVREADPDASSSGAWTLRTALAYLAQPLEVLVENERNDGVFFLSVFEATMPAVAARFGGVRPGVRFGHGGGKAEVLRLIESRFSAALEGSSVPPRLFIIVDSDSRFSGHLTAESQDLQRVCEKFEVPLFLLRKRSIENYVSNAQLQEYATRFPDVRGSVNFLVGLDSTQRDYFPVKSGIAVRQGVPTDISDEERQLYAGVVWPSDFSPKLKRVMEFVLSQRPAFTSAHLTARDSYDEFALIAEKLDEEI